MLKNFMNVLNMKPDNFYPMLANGILGVLSIIFALIQCVNIWKNRPKLRKVFNLYCKREGDNFYIKIVLLEMAGMVGSAFGAVIMYGGIEMICLPQGYIRKWGIVFTAVISVTINVVLSVIMVKRVWVRKRLLGDKMGRKIVRYGLFFINADIMFGMLNMQGISYIFLGLYAVCEVMGVLYFRGRYVKYEHSSMYIYLKTGEKVICQEIEKVKVKKDLVIIEEDNRHTIVSYEDIGKVEYYGSPKYILIGNSRKR